VGSSRISLQKDDTRYDINLLSHMLKWIFEVEARFVALLDLKGLSGEMSLSCTTITTANGNFLIHHCRLAVDCRQHDTLGFQCVMFDCRLSTISSVANNELLWIGNENIFQ